MLANEPKTLNFTKTEGIFNISILSLNKDVKLTFTDVSPKPYDGFQIPQPSYFEKLSLLINNSLSGSLVLSNSKKVQYIT